MEADLARHYRIDLADHWRRDDTGQRVLTLRKLRVLIAYLPDDSALVRAADPNMPWSIGDVLLAHIWQAVALSKAPHPMLAAETRRIRSATEMTPARLRIIAEARQRASRRREAIAAGTIT